MTCLVRVKGPGYDLRVCGTPSRAWLDWLLTAQVPLTDDQTRWRDAYAAATGSRVPGAGPASPRVWPPPGVQGRWGVPRGAAQDGAEQ